MNSLCKSPAFSKTMTMYRAFAASNNNSHGDSVEPIGGTKPKKPYVKQSNFIPQKTKEQYPNQQNISSFDNKPRLAFEGVKIKPRGINYFSDQGVALTVDVVPAQFKNIDGS